MQTIHVRVKILSTLFSIIILLVSYSLIIQCGVVKGASPEVDQRVSLLQKQEKYKCTYEGNILDRKSIPLTTEADSPGCPGEIINPHAFSCLIGYNSAIYGKTGLRSYCADYLYEGNKDNKGATLTLTVDSQLQEAAYQAIGENVGSCIILNNTTGEIIAAASRTDSDTEYNANDIDQAFDRYSQIESFWYNRCFFTQDPPGSTFKIVTAACLLENGLDSFTYIDNGIHNGIHNAGNAAYGKLNLESALIHSSNVFFAAASDTLGGAKLEKTAKSFMIGESIPLEFGPTVNSNWDLDGYRKDVIERTAFGQGNLQVSPFNIACIMQAIINNGKMIKPCMIQTIENDGKILYTKDKDNIEVISEPVSEDTASALKHLLSSVADAYGFESDKYGTIYAKTGTAQIPNTNLNHIYLVFGTDDYTGILSVDRTYNSSHSLIEPAKGILEQLQLLE